MDKLKQVLLYKFWILLGLAIILPFVGWIMIRSDLIKDAEARTTELTNLYGNLKIVPEDANNDWAREATKLNQAQQLEVRAAWEHLYERQLPLMKWPPNIVGDADKMEPKHLERYRVDYPKELEKVRQIARPVDVGENGVIEFSDAVLTNYHRELEWQTKPPSVKQVIDSQEDLWLLTSLLNSINAVNKNATSQFDAPIREIVTLTLRGGGPKGPGGAKPAAAASGGGGSANAMAGMMSSMAKMADMAKASGVMGGGAMGMGMGSNGGGAAGGLDSSVPVNADEEFGAERPAAAEKGATAAAKPAATGAASGAAAMANMMGAMGAMGAMGSTGAAPSMSAMERYIDTKDQWKTRGFQLELVMDHRRVPELLVELSNGAWPVKIVRVQQADYRDEELAPAESQGGMPLAAGSGGAGASSMAAMMAMAGRGGAAGGMMPGSRGMSGRSGAPMTSGPMMAGAGGRRGGAPARASSGDDDEGEAGRVGAVGLGAGSSAMSGYGGAGGTGNEPTPYDDLNLANVSILGVITIFNKPKEEPAAAPGASPAASPAVPTAAAGAPAAGAPAAGSPAATGATAAVPVGAGTAESAASGEAAEEMAADADETEDAADEPEEQMTDEAEPATDTDDESSDAGAADDDKPDGPKAGAGA